MATKAIVVSGLGKQYRRGVSREPYGSLRDTLVRTMSAPFRTAASIFRRSRNGKESTDDTLFWALQDVSFAINEGETVGVIGANGAGKSTLLKLLSRITEPTAGCLEIYGRAGSLLEVGTGFHPELTGRENIFLNGAILGMRRTEITRRFDEIVAFAELEKFVDTPVKYYSSGMYLRLAFAVAAHLDPEILLVDEVLAVGDAAFQKRCLGRMNEVSRQGRTVIFVSHNMTALKALCRRAIWLDKGRLIEDGEASEVVDHYLQRHAASRLESSWDDPNTAPGNEKVRLHYVRVIPQNEDGAEGITVHTPLKVEFAYWNYVPGQVLNISFFLNSIEETCIFNVSSEAHPRPVGLIREMVEIPGDLLNTGVYYVRAMVVKDTSRSILDYSGAATFEVLEGQRAGQWYGRLPGAVRPKLKWTAVEEVEGPKPAGVAFGGR